MKVYVGTYTRKEGHVDGKGKGIALLHFDSSKGILSSPSGVYEVGENPAYLHVSKNGKLLFVANEIPESTVSSYRVEDDGKLTHISTQATHGSSACHLVLDHTQKHLFVANYTSGNFTHFHVSDDGKLSEGTLTQHHGSGPNPQRQEGPHAHAVVFHPTLNYLYIPDLGIDKVMGYELDVSSGKIKYISGLELEAGEGPRHMVFHPKEPFAYVVNELKSSVTVCKFHSDGKLESIQKISTLPSSYSPYPSNPSSPPLSTCAAIRITSNGKFLFVSNRGHDSLAIFKVDSTNGKIEAVGYEPTGGQVPRDFQITPDDKFVLAQNQNSDNIRTYLINQETGELKFNGNEVKVFTPVCIDFANN